MKKLSLLLSVLGILNLTSCGGGEKQPPSPNYIVDAVQIQFFKDGKDDKATNRVLTRRDTAEVRRVRTWLQAPAAEEYKCGYSGRIVLMQGASPVKDIAFQLQPDCRHLSWVEGEILRTAVLSEADAAWLTGLQASPWSLDELEFMLGSWQQIEKDSAVSTETWTRDGDHFDGRSYTIYKGDTVFSEKLSILPIGSGLVYMADVAENPAPVDFKLNFLEGNMAGFENPTHDWPQRVIYVRLSPDSLQARVEGTKDGNFASKGFYLTRIK